MDADSDGGLDKDRAKAALATERARIQALQEKLYAERRRSLLVVFQAIDTGGKDGTIRTSRRREPAGLQRRLVQGARRPRSATTTSCGATTGARRRAA